MRRAAIPLKKKETFTIWNLIYLCIVQSYSSIVSSACDSINMNELPTITIIIVLSFLWEYERTTIGLAGQKSAITITFIQKVSELKEQINKSEEN